MVIGPPVSRVPLSDEAIRQYRQALELDPKDASVHKLLGDAYQRTGLERAAVAEWRIAFTLTGDPTLAEVLGGSYTRHGLAVAQRALARKQLQHYTGRSNRGEFVPAIDYARAYIRLGQKEQALQWLAKACNERNRFAFFINTDPFYDPLRGDARFESMAKSLGVPN